MFKEHGIVKIANVLDPKTCKLLADYICLKAKTRTNIRRGDALSGVHREYGDPLMEILLEQLTPTVEAATGLKLWPTLSFYYHYSHGNALAPHKDRSSCEIVAGLCIGSDPEFSSSNSQWPLLIKGVAPIPLNFGDILVFKGHTMEHWRDRFSGTWFASAIFGFVDQNGPYAFQKYDQRKGLGEKHIGMTAWYLGHLVNKFLKYSIR